MDGILAGVLICTSCSSQGAKQQRLKLPAGLGIAMGGANVPLKEGMGPLAFPGAAVQGHSLGLDRVAKSLAAAVYPVWELLPLVSEEQGVLPVALLSGAGRPELCFGGPAWLKGEGAAAKQSLAKAAEP